MLMKTASILAVLLLVLTASDYGQTDLVTTEDVPSSRALDTKVARFDVRDATLIDALSNLSNQPIAGLHLGIEEIIRSQFSEPTDRTVRFSVSLQDVTVRDIMDALGKSDRRYTWSVDGSSVNVYPRAIVGNSTYLLNRELDSIAFSKIDGPSDALTALAKLLPGEQLGYAGIGAGVNNDYAKPWTATLDKLTVRQLMNRLSEHNGSRGGWIWSGATGQRFFAYFERGFKR
jgi:hypothetical protein